MIYEENKYIKLQTIKDTYILEGLWSNQTKNISDLLNDKAYKNAFIKKLIKDYPTCFIRKCSHDNIFYPLLDFNNSSICTKNLSLKKRKSSKDNVGKNLPILRMLKNGDPDKILKCFSDSVENISIYPTNDFSPKTVFQLHHPCFHNGKSNGKLKKEPSKYISSLDLTDTNDLDKYDAKVEGINQILLCQLMSETCHSIIHQSYSSDNLQRYIDDPIGYDTSYHFLSQKNYNECLDYIETFGYERDHLLSYENMLLINLEHAPVKKT